MKQIVIKSVIEGNVPKYMTSGSAGADIFAYISSARIIKPMERAIIPTGLKAAIPEGYEIQLRPRSGLSFKKGLTLINSPGTIDSDYRDEIGVIVINLGSEDITINPNDRIAQMVVNQVVQAKFESVSDIMKNRAKIQCLGLLDDIYLLKFNTYFSKMGVFS